MFNPIAVCIGLRYLRAKRRHRFISFMSFASMLGIALGVMVLITVLSVMNGFDQQIQQRIFHMANHVTITHPQGIGDWPALRAQLLREPRVQAAAPFVAGQGILTHRGRVHSVLVTGIEPTLQRSVTQLTDKLIQGSANGLHPGEFGVLLGQQLAADLGARVGDKVVLVTPKAAVTVVGLIPTFKRFTVVGIFKVGNGFGFDSQYAFVHLRDAQVLYGLAPQWVSGLRLRIDTLYHAPQVAQSLLQHGYADYQISNWSQQYGELFKAVAMEKTMMFLTLLLIIMIAVFNLISSLVMVVTDKQAEIAILRTLGATPSRVMAIFMVQGSVIGLVGTLLGVLGGVLLALHVTEVVAWLEALLHVKLFASDAYYVDFLPSELRWMDVLRISAIAFGLSVLATIYPAWRAACTLPAEALRYE